MASIRYVGENKGGVSVYWLRQGKTQSFYARRKARQRYKMIVSLTFGSVRPTGFERFDYKTGTWECEYDYRIEVELIEKMERRKNGRIA